MNLQYVPLSKALDAEKIALENIDPAIRRRIIPLFDIPRVPAGDSAPKYLYEFGTPAKTMIDYAISRIASVSPGLMAMVDSYHWLGNANIETGEHVFSYLINQLTAKGVIAIPVIGYDRWEDTTYRAATRLFNYTRFPLTCLRLDYSAIEDSLEPDLLQENIESILDDLELHPSKCCILIDFGDIYSKQVSEINDEIARVINVLEIMNFKFFITAACSLPATVDKAIQTTDTEGQFRRKEMAAWKMISKSAVGRRNKIIYGDYAIRGPQSNEGVRNKHSNGKIRYTIDEHFFIARGHSVSQGDKFGQFYKLAERVISSIYYKDPNYSWGDKQIVNAVAGLTPKTHAFWISVDTNHHITYVIEENLQFSIDNSINSNVVAL